MIPLNDLTIESFCLTLLHSLWQVGVLALAAWLIQRMLGRARVRTAYIVYSVALVAGLIAIPVTFLFVNSANQPEIVAENQPAATGSQPSIEPTSEPGALDILSANGDQPKEIGTEPQRNFSAPDSAVAIDPPGMTVADSRPATPADAESGAVGSESSGAADWWRPVFPWILCVYVLGVGVMIARLLRSVYLTERMKVAAQPIVDGPVYDALRKLCAKYKSAAAPALAHARNVVVPKVVGLIKPTILLPTSALTGMSTEELSLVLAHELAHVRRYDLWINLIQRIAEAVLFFNPAMWWLSRRVSTLREFCCDDQVCHDPSADSGSQLRYARALLHCAEMNQENVATQANALAASGRSPSELRRRIARVLGDRSVEPFQPGRFGILVMLILSAALLMGPALWTTSVANARAVQEEEGDQERGDQERGLLREIAGGEIELLLVGDCENVGRWWATDGTPRPKALWQYRSLHLEPDHAPDQIARTFLIRTDGIEGLEEIEWSITKGTRIEVDEPNSADGEQRPEFVVVVATINHEGLDHVTLTARSGSEQVEFADLPLWPYPVQFREPVEVEPLLGEWGPVVDGLQASIQFRGGSDSDHWLEETFPPGFWGDPTREPGVVKDSDFAPLIFVRNVSDHEITFASELRRTGDSYAVIGPDGKELQLTRRKELGEGGAYEFPINQRVNLRPGDVAKFEVIDFILNLDEPPGQYRLNYAIRIASRERVHSKWDYQPRPGDFAKDLPTGGAVFYLAPQPEPVKPTLTARVFEPGDDSPKDGYRILLWQQTDNTSDFTGQMMPQGVVDAQVCAIWAITVWTDPDGVSWIWSGYELQNESIPAGRYRATAVANKKFDNLAGASAVSQISASNGISEPFEITEGEQHSIDIHTIGGDASLKVVIRDSETNEPVPGYLFRFRNEGGLPVVNSSFLDGEFRSRRTANIVETFRDGTLEILELAPGEYSVQLIGKFARINEFIEYELEEAWRAVEVKPGANEIELFVKPTRLGPEEIDRRFPYSIFGKVTDQDGNPMPGVEVVSYMVSPRLQVLDGEKEEVFLNKDVSVLANKDVSVLTDENGEYRMHVTDKSQLSNVAFFNNPLNGLEGHRFYVSKPGWKLETEKGHLLYFSVVSEKELARQLRSPRANGWKVVDSIEKALIPSQPREVNFVLVPDDDR